MLASQNQANLKQVRWYYCFCRELELGTGVCMYFPVYHQGGYLLNRPSWHSALVFKTQNSQLPFGIISHCVHPGITRWHQFSEMFFGSSHHQNSIFSLSRRSYFTGYT